MRRVLIKFFPQTIVSIGFVLAIWAGPASAATLVRHWKFDDGAADPNSVIAVDTTGNANGTLNGFSTPPAWTTGKIAGGLQFDGQPLAEGDYVSAGSNVLGTAYTITVWFKADAFRPFDDPSGDPDHILLGQYDGGGPGRAFFEARSRDNGLGETVVNLDFFEGGGAGHIAGTTALQTGSWYFGVITRSGSSGQLYLNAAPETNFTYQVEGHPNAANEIGGSSHFGGFGFFPGIIDDLRVYDDALTAQEITDLYNEGATVPGDFDGDGDVDGADFVAWQTHFPTAMNATLADGDADGDGDVDGADFVVWQTNFPFTPGPGVSPVPEPQTLLLFFMGALAMCGLRRRDRR